MRAAEIESCECCGGGVETGKARAYRIVDWTTNNKGKRIPVLEEIKDELWEDGQAVAGTNLLVNGDSSG